MARFVCQDVHRLAVESSLGKDFGLKDQMLRSSGSIMDNIAEGFDSGSNREFIRFLQYAKRSCSELQSQLYRCIDRGHLPELERDKLHQKVSQNRAAIGGFINYLTRNLEARKMADTRHPQHPATGNRQPPTAN